MTQAKFIPAIAALHNFLRAHQHLADDGDMPPIAPLPELMVYNDVLSQEGAISDEEKERAANRCDQIANLMWENYIRAELL